MEFTPPLLEGRFQRRYKRFFADIEFEGETLVAHCPNTGSMMGLKEPGARCRFSKNDDPKRKLKYTLEMIHTPGGWVGVHTGRPNHLVKELFEKKPLPHWTQWDSAQSEVKISPETRLDLALWKADEDTPKKWTVKNLMPPLHFIEIKNVTLSDDQGTALFPDAVTTRGQKHLKELMALQETGYTTELVFVVQREDCKEFAPATDIDPEYGRLLKQAQQKGVRITPLEVAFSDKELQLTGKILDLNL